MARVCSIKEYSPVPVYINKNSQVKNNIGINPVAIATNATNSANKFAITPEYYRSILNINFGNTLHTQDIKPGCNYNKETQTLEFGILSNNATHIKLYIFDKPINGNAIETIEMEKDGNKFTATVDKETQQKLHLDIKKETPVYYGYRAWGPNWEYDEDWTPGSDIGFKEHVDSDGNRFNPNKLLFDPYAKELSHDPVSPNNQGDLLTTALYVSGDENYLEDTAPFSPKGIFISPKKIVDTGKKPKRAIKDDVIYEVHLRGFTMLDERIPDKYKGTYKGAGMKAKYLKDLGVTMVEFLPVQEFQNDTNDEKSYKHDYWGYNPINWFSPDRRYSSDKSPGGPTREFKEMVQAFHAEGIKVCMDVVYNHTGEASVECNGNSGLDEKAIYSLRGLDNATYYEIDASGKGFYDNTGCGGNVNIANPITRDIVIDSIKYWSEEMGVDAFRHDLASVLGNTVEKNGFVFDAIDDNYYLQKVKEKVDVRSRDGKTGSVDLIAEPWGAKGDDTRQIGNFPHFWMEWNDLYRNTIRRTLNQQETIAPAEFTTAVAGSFDNVFKNKTITRSINFITCHDGFTLKDLFSYNQKNNNQEGFESDGGTDDNISWDNENDFVRQKKAMRNALLTLMTSRGTPMMLGGDEIIRTLYGNNNAYNQDKPKNYLDWDLDKDKKQMQEFTKRVIHFRNNHPVLRDNRLFKDKDGNHNGLKNITWLKDNGKEADDSYKNYKGNEFIAYRIDGTEFEDSITSLREPATSIYTALNKGDKDIQLTLPKNLEDKKWYFVADTSEYSEEINNFEKEGDEIEVKSMQHNIAPRSMMVFVEK